VSKGFRDLTITYASMWSFLMQCANVCVSLNEPNSIFYRVLLVLYLHFV
jgi:hypothetical protein